MEVPACELKQLEGKRMAHAMVSHLGGIDSLVVLHECESTANALGKCNLLDGADLCKVAAQLTLGRRERNVANDQTSLFLRTHSKRDRREPRFSKESSRSCWNGQIENSDGECVTYSFSERSNCNLHASEAERKVLEAVDGTQGSLGCTVRHVNYSSSEKEREREHDQSRIQSHRYPLMIWSFVSILKRIKRVVAAAAIVARTHVGMIDLWLDETGRIELGRVSSELLLDLPREIDVLVDARELGHHDPRRQSTRIPTWVRHDLEHSTSERSDEMARRKRYILDLALARAAIAASDRGLASRAFGVGLAAATACFCSSS